MHIAYRAESLIDAHLVKDALEREQIPVFIAGEYLVGGVGQLPARDYLAVMVPESAAVAAEGVVREVEQIMAQSRLAMGDQDDDAQATVPDPA